MTLTAHSNPSELLASSLQAGFLAFTVYLSAVILRILLRGKSMLQQRHHCIGEDCTDGSGAGEDHIDTMTHTLTIPITYPTILPPPQPKKSFSNEKIQAVIFPMDLFASDNLYNLVQHLQSCIDSFENYVQTAHPNEFIRYNWKVIVEAQSTEFRAGNLDGLKPKPVVNLDYVSYSGTFDPVPSTYPFQKMYEDLKESLESYPCWKGNVHAVWIGDSTSAQPLLTTSTTVVSKRTTAPRMGLTSQVPRQLHHRAILKHI